jgi:hypothetical protein
MVDMRPWPKLVSSVIYFAVLSISCSGDTNRQAVTGLQKKQFLEMLRELPRDREFYTAEAVKTTSRFTNVLFALDKTDVSDDHLYPLEAISQGLLENEDQRNYGRKNFDVIRHPAIKLFWGVVLFDKKAASPEIIDYLRESLSSKERSEILKDILGDKYETFRKRISL